MKILTINRVKYSTMFCLFISALIFVMDSCSTENYIFQTGASLDFYLISDYQTKKNSYKIINNSVILSDTKIFEYSDIVSYSSKNYTFIVSDNKSDILNYESNYFHEVPFALAIDKEIIYTGYFWGMFSSWSCDWVTIDPMKILARHEIIVQLGYNSKNGKRIPDRRNDPRIINLLRQANKLID